MVAVKSFEIESMRRRPFTFQTDIDINAHGFSLTEPETTFKLIRRPLFASNTKMLFENFPNIDCVRSTGVRLSGLVED